MKPFDLETAYDFSGRTFVVTGGTGALCGTIASALVERGANVAVLSRNGDRPNSTFKGLSGSDRVEFHATDVLSFASLCETEKRIREKWGAIDGLINGAGGNRPEATTSGERNFFDISEESLRQVIDLNLLGTILPSQVFGASMAENENGGILNISSMTADRPLTRVVGYSVSKAAIDNFTRWLAVHLANEISPNLRVNAIAPGFFLSEQNSTLLIDKQTGEMTERGKRIIEHTPMKRFGDPQDLIGVSLWLLSPASRFVTGVVVPIDGGFSAYSGV